MDVDDLNPLPDDSSEDNDNIIDAASGPESDSDAGSLSSDSDSDEYASDINAHKNHPYRCLLCRFRLKKGDPYMIHEDAVPDGASTGPFVYDYEIAPRLEKLDDRVRNYMDDDTNRARDGGYHFSCFRLMDKERSLQWYHISKEAWRYSVTPTTGEEMRRLKRTRQLLAPRLASLFPDGRARLPPEIWHMVLQADSLYNDIIKQVSIMSRVTLWRRRNVCNSQLDVRKSIWAHYVFVDGIRYVQRLTHSPPDGLQDKKTCLQILKGVLDGEAAKRYGRKWYRNPDKTVLYVLEDHLGIRQIIFASPDDKPPHPNLGNIRNPWWHTISFRHGQQLRTWTDGLKVRTLDAVDLRTPVKNRDFAINVVPEKTDMLWRVPTAPPAVFNEKIATSFRNPFPSWPKTDSGHWYMETMTVNAPDTVAYSAFWFYGSIVALHAHRRSDGTTDPHVVARMHQDLRDRCRGGIWSYFPVADGERLDELFLRRVETRHDTTPFLVFRTSLGRYWMIENSDEQIHDREDEIEHLCSFHTNDGEPSRIHYNTFPVGIQFLCFENAGPLEHLPPEPIPVGLQFGRPSDENFKSRYIGPYLTSTASLDGVVAVTPSFKPVDDCHRYFESGGIALCGLLLEYADSKKYPPAVLGEYRPYTVGEKVDLRDADADADALYFISKPNYPESSYESRSSGDTRDPPWVQMSSRVPESDFVWVTAKKAILQLFGIGFICDRLPLSGQVDMWHSESHVCIYSPMMTRLKDNPYKMTSITIR